MYKLLGAGLGNLGTWPCLSHPAKSANADRGSLLCALWDHIATAIADASVELAMASSTKAPNGLTSDAPNLPVGMATYQDCPAQLPIACTSGFAVVAAHVPRYLGPGT